MKYILSTKLENKFKDKNYMFQLNNTKRCGVNIGCSGFITNNDNHKIVFVDTHSISDLIFLKQVESYQTIGGGKYYFIVTLDDLCSKINELLE